MFMVVSYPWPVASAYAGLVDQMPAKSRLSRHDLRHGPHRDPRHDLSQDDSAQRELVGASQAG
jgi:hypothetical protein